MGIEIANHASNKLSVLIDILRGVDTNYICHLCTELHNILELG